MLVFLLLDSAFFRLGARTLLEELRLLAQDVAQQQVGQAAGAQAEQGVVEPFLAQHFLDDGVVDEGVVHRIDASGRLESHFIARFIEIFLDGLAHDVGRFGRGGRLQLAGRGLDEVGAGIHRQDGRGLDVRGRAQGACLENHLQVLVLARLLQFLNLVAHAFIVAHEELAYGDHDVYLVGAVHDGHGRFGHLDFGEGLRGGETARYAGYLHVFHFERVLHNLGEVGVDADGGHVLQVGELFVEAVHVLGEAHHALVAVGGLQRGEVDAVEEELLDLGGIVGGHLFVDDGLYLRSHFRIVEAGVVLGQRFIVLAFGRFIFLHVPSV